MKPRIELLSPAADASVMKACFSAGADAVYMGLSRFSARAYAINEPPEDYLEAVSYAHLHGKKLYLTLNTLMKEAELRNEIEPLLRPLYNAGLDGVIVQDVGLMAYLTARFPLLPIHVSTQAAVFGPGTANLFKDLNVTRLVLPRELSLEEIAELHEKTDLELEVFIHGALCYCYSGQCLFSSLAGGRSGNRGRCAQPCRLNYRFEDEKGTALSDPDAPYLMSLKDFNTLRKLPEILRAGAVSLKIEGRMKKAEYAAGVTAVYRKYLDVLLAHPEMIEGKAAFTVDPEDEKTLFQLFNRQGFTDAYLTKKNGRDMLALREKEPRAVENSLLEKIRKEILDRPLKTAVEGVYAIRRNAPMALSLRTSLDGKTFETAVCSGHVPEEAKTRGTTASEVEKQLLKTGTSEFAFSSLSGTLDDGLFLPVAVLNELRRNALEKLSETILSAYRRNEP